MEGNQVVEGAVVDVPAKVAVPEVGTEMPVISKERWEEIQRWQAEGQSVSQIARVTGLALLPSRHFTSGACGGYCLRCWWSRWP